MFNSILKFSSVFFSFRFSLGFSSVLNRFLSSKQTKRTPRSPGGIPRGLPLLTPGKQTRKTLRSPGGIPRGLPLLTPGKRDKGNVPLIRGVLRICPGWLYFVSYRGRLSSLKTIDFTDPGGPEPQYPPPPPCTLLFKNIVLLFLESFRKTLLWF